ncbi:chromosomal replication initiator DnaA [Sphingomonas cavernae]|uniref:Chromosomal replication initiator DnaA n=2 Tax=Sphingomonas cavernae TaxID=2320861 RepID=A0A418WM39_9SPHN|nr:chromosomal replication initiator DnaA [Sphingomonas cavernae]
MSQIALPLDWPADETDADFIVSPCNAVAVRHLEHVGTWPVWATLLVGPRKSGRSLLGRIFALKSHGTLIDNAEEQGEDRIFHAWNMAQEARRPLLIIADRAPPEWKPRLADLRSRLAATPLVRIDQPDDALIDALIERLLAQRGILTRPDFRAYATARIERSYIAVMRFVDMVDHLALEKRGTKIAIPLAKRVLAEMGVIDESPVLF